MNRIVAAATVIAALTFGVMIGAFYIAEQYLQRVAGFSALGAAAALVLVALLVGVAAPLAGKLVDTRGEVVVTVLGFLGTGIGLVVLGIGGVPLDDLVTILPLIPVGLGLGMLFVPVSRAALNATPQASHGRTSAMLSVGRLLGAAVGASLAGVALSGTLTADSVHHALLIGAAVCLLVGIPSSLCLRSGRRGAAATPRAARLAISDDSVPERPLYIVEVDDQCDPRLVGHSGSSYASPPQPEIQALALVRMLLGSSTRPLAVAEAPFRTPIAGGQRVIRLHRAGADGQLQI